MPPEEQEEVAADSSATQTPVSNTEGSALAEEVELAPSTAEVGPEVVGITGPTLPRYWTRPRLSALLLQLTCR